MRFDIDRKIGTAEGRADGEGETRASCDSRHLRRGGEGRALWRAKATNGSSSMTGQRMELWYNEDEVERVLLPETGRLMQAPGKGSPWREDSWIEGDSVSIYLSNESVDSVRIMKGAKAMYYPIEGRRARYRTTTRR